MQDLNDLFIFSQVVEHSGFTGAARALGVARSSICRRVGQLEEHLGVRLVQRSTRHFAVTDLGLELHAHCIKMLAEANAAFERMACARAKPSGLIRVSCTPILAQLLVSPIIPEFTEKNPEVRIAIEATNRRIDLDEKVDLFIRVRQIPSQDSGMIMRSLGIVQQVLVASPAFIARQGRPGSPEEAARLPSIGSTLQGPHVWKLVDGQGAEMHVRYEPRLISDDLVLVRQAALHGVGIAQLPLSVCIDDIRRGELEVVLPDYPQPLFEVQVLFASRRGMLPAVRSFIDFLSAHCVSEVPDRQIERHNGRGPRENARYFTSPKALEQLVTRGPMNGHSAPREVRLA